MLSDEVIYHLNDSLKDLAVTAAIHRMDKYVQHGDTTCLWHSIAVAYYSLTAAKLLHIPCRQKSLLIGALLHDYFLYDWHVKDKSHRLHGFRHPKFALTNAKKVRNLTHIECDIIEKHMFPLTIVPPVYKESILVCIVDKICSFYETFWRGTYKSLKQKCSVDIKFVYRM